MNKKKLAKVYYADLWGLREKKYEHLLRSDIQTTRWKKLKPLPPYYFFVPKDFALQNEYEKFWKVTDIFKEWSSGVETGKDSRLVGFSPQDIIKVFLDIFNPKITIKELEIFHNLKQTSGWRIIDRRKELFRNGEIFSKEKIIYYAYRPFDIRFTCFCYFLRRAHSEIMKNMLKENIALVTSRLLASAPYRHILITQNVIDRCYVSMKTKETGYIFPLSIYNKKPENRLYGKEQYKLERIPNFNPAFLQAIKESLGKELAPEEIFSYIYAILYSPAYRKRHEEFLKIDFPRIPLPSNYLSFQKLSKLGKELVEIHLLKHTALSSTEIAFPIGGSNKVEKVVYEEKKKMLFINKDQYFENVSKDIWEYRIGAYQVMEKYLKDRKGRKLSLDEINHYLKMSKAIHLTMRIQKEIDRIYQ